MFTYKNINIEKNNSVYFTIINIFLQLNFFNRHQLNELF
jgi:hypothetical protein